MAATLVLDPTEGGWNIVNYDDFRNSMSAFIDRSFIPYPSEDSGITDEQAIDEVAGYLGASGWTTTSELEDEAGTAGLRGFLEDEEPQLERKPRNKRDVQMKESSKKTASFYDFYDEFANPDGSGTYSLYYGEKGNNSYYEQLYAEESDDGSELNCYFINCHSDIVDEFTTETWEEAKEDFMFECEHGDVDFELHDAYENMYNIPWEERFSTKKASSSIRKSSEYEFWDKDDSDPSFITGQYGIPGDYVNSKQWNAIQIDDGRWDVSVVGADGFPKEVGLYRTISEAGSALLQYLNENGTTASFNKEGRMSASVRKSYIGSFWGDTQDNGFGGYEYYYGEDGEENNSVMLYGTPDGDKVECQVMSPEGDILDSYSADSWEEAKGRFDTDCVINHMYEDCIYDPQDPYLRFHETASVKKASAYEFLDDYTYGDPDDEGNSVTLELEEDGDDWDASIFAPDGNPGELNEILDDGWFESEEDAIEWFKNECTSSSRIKQVLDENRSDASATASVKTSMDEDSNGYSFWGEEPIDDGGFSVWYGEFQEPQNSLPVDVEYYDASSFSYDPDDPGYFTISLHTSTEWDAEDLSSEISDVSQDTLDEVWEELKQDLPNIASRHLIPIKEFDEMKMNGEIATASVKKSSEFRFWSHGDDGVPDFYGEEGNELNSFEIIIDTFGGDIVAEVWARSYERRDIPCAARKEHFTSVEEAQKWAEDKCVELADQYLDPDFFDDSLDFNEFFFGKDNEYLLR